MASALRSLTPRSRRQVAAGNYRAAVVGQPGVMANRLAELQRQIAEDRLTDSRRAMAEAAVEGIQAAFTAEVRCHRCGRLLTDPESRSLGIGPDCIRKGAA